MVYGCEYSEIQGIMPLKMIALVERNIDTHIIVDRSADSHLSCCQLVQESVTGT